MAVVQAVAHQTLTGIDVTSNFFFAIDGGDSGDFQDTADTIENLYTTLAPNLSPAWGLTKVAVRIPDGTGAPYQEFATPVGGGQPAGDIIARGNHLLIYGKSYQPPPNKTLLRLWGFTESHNAVDGKPTAGILTAMNAAVVYLLGISLINLKPAYWACVRLESSGGLGAPHDTVGAYNQVTSAVLRGRWYVLRSVQKK